MEINSTAISDNILKYRIMAKLNQKQLANIVGLTSNYISALENNNDISPSMDSLMKIASATNVTVEQLLFENLNVLKNKKEDDLIDQINKSLYNFINTNIGKFILKIKILILNKAVVNPIPQLLLKDYIHLTLCG